MEKHPNPFDELLKETLKGHQLAPPEEAKKAFLREAGSIIQTRRTFIKWYYLPILAGLLIGIISVFYYENTNEIKTSKSIINEQVNPTSGLTAETPSTSSTTSISNAAREINPGPASIPASVSATKSGSKSEPSAGFISAPAEPSTKSNEQPAVSSVSIADRGIAMQHDTLISSTRASKLALDSPVQPAIPETVPSQAINPAGRDTSSAAIVDNKMESSEPAKVQKANRITAGVYYLPEWMFNTVEGGKYVNNFGIEGNFYSGRVSVRTGAGISISKGTTDKAVEYNDYLGTYNKLDSITFMYNESSHDFMPNIYTSKEKVWDSIAKLDSSSLVKRYTYLQVPLVLGFDFLQKGRISVGVRIGTIMSVMLQSKQITGTYDPGENHVLGIRNITPDQVSINWQAVGGLNASVTLTKSFYFEFEPEAKYYYQSIYEKSGFTKKPWSIGIRAAVVYKF